MAKEKIRTGTTTRLAKWEKVPDVSAAGSEVVLAVVADVHAGLTAPVFRSGEKDWFVAQSRPWVKIRQTCRKYDVPLAICGDLFDKWDARPEVVNWLITVLPRKQKVYAVPGNHDLPNHDIKNIQRSAYWTLVKAGCVENINDMGCEAGPKLWLTGFGQGSPVRGHDAEYVHGTFPKDMVTVAIVHDYCWDTGKAFVGAPANKHWSAHLKAAKGAHRVVCFGDNHREFLVQDESRTVVNCGGLLIRNSDELDRKPRITLIHANGKVSFVPLDTEEDVYDHELVKDVKSYGMDEDAANELMAAAKDLAHVSVNFRQVIKDLVRSTGVRQAVAGVLKDWLNKADEEK